MVKKKQGQGDSIPEEPEIIGKGRKLPFERLLPWNKSWSKVVDFLKSIGTV